MLQAGKVAPNFQATCGTFELPKKKVHEGTHVMRSIVFINYTLALGPKQ